MKSLFGCVLLSLFLIGCADAVDIEEEQSQVTLDSAAECPPNSNLSYDNFGSAFLLANPGVEVVSVVYEPGPGATSVLNEVSAEERELLGEWLACGAP